MHSGDVHIPAGEELFQGHALIRCLGMQGKGKPFYFYVIFFGQAIGTDRTEIAPRSDVIREYFKDRAFFHMSLPILS